jgi:hypothetical protein
VIAHVNSDFLPVRARFVKRVKMKAGVPKVFRESKANSNTDTTTQARRGVVSCTTDLAQVRKNLVASLLYCSCTMVKKAKSFRTPRIQLYAHAAPIQS